MEDVPVPEEINCGEQVFDVAFHTNANVLAVGLIDGSVDVWRYGLDDVNQLIFKNNYHTSSCRGIAFSENGETLYSISSDRSLQGLSGTGQQAFQYSLAHDEPINKLISITDCMLATGDDSGVVKLWDVRTAKGEVSSWHLHEDFVSGFCYHEESNTLLSVAGDATLCVYDLRNPSNTARSDDQESELHCVQVIKGGKKVICGSQEGVVVVFSWSRWGDCSDRFPGHPQTIDCMLKVDESTVITGSSDGLIRVVAIQPNKVLGVIGDHEGFPVEGICISSDRRLLGSFAHDEIIRFWDVSMFVDDDREEDGEEQEEAVAPLPRAERAKGKAAESGGDLAMEDVSEDGEGDWEDVDGSDSEGGEEQMDESSGDDGDDSSSDDEIDNNYNAKRIPSKNEKFYADL